MSDLTIPLIGLTTLVGYYFSKNGKTPREEIVNREKIENFDKPNGDNIYTSNVVTEANTELLNRSLQNYTKSAKPSETGFIPPLYNVYSTVGKSPEEIEKEISSLTSQQLGELNDKNRIGVASGASSGDIQNMPMFRSMMADLSEKDVSKDINLLTGKPYEKEHNNMVPFFGSNTKQNMEGFANTGILDNYTGRTFEYQHKKEVPSFYDTKPENINGMPVHVDTIKDRYIKSIYKQGEKPFEPIRVQAPKSGTYENDIRPEFRPVEELRPGNKPKLTYEGVMLPGQINSVRGVTPEVKKNRPNTFYESSPDRYFNGPGQFVAPKIDENYKTNFKTSSREQYNIEYYGIANSGALNKTVQRMKGESIDNSKELIETFTNVDRDEVIDSLSTAPKRINFENDWVRNVNYHKMVNDYGKSSMKQYNTERMTTEQNFQIGNMNVSGNSQVVLKPTDKIKTTLKETTLRKNDSGNIKTVFNQNKTESNNNGMSDNIPRNTQKQHLIDNKYLGQSSNGQNGLGYLSAKYDAKTTNKQLITNNSDYKGNPHYQNETYSKTQYNNAQIKDNKQDLLLGQRPGGANRFQISSGKNVVGDIKSNANMLLKEEVDKRQNMNTITAQTIPDKNIINWTSGHKKEMNDNRFDTNIINAQLSNNPYIIDTSKRDDSKKPVHFPFYEHQ